MGIHFPHPLPPFLCQLTKNYGYLLPPAALLARYVAGSGFAYISYQRGGMAVRAISKKAVKALPSFLLILAKKSNVSLGFSVPRSELLHCNSDIRCMQLQICRVADFN